MSLEIQAGHGCPHIVQEEPVLLGSDRRSLSTRAPIAGAASVRVLVNNSQYVPSSGLFSQAVLTSASAGPYRIQRCVGTVGPDGNLFTVTTGSGVVSVRLPEGDRVTLARIQRTLKLSGINDLVLVTEENGALSLVESQDAGPSSFIRVSGLGATSLGFLQTGARGQQVYPGWELLANEDIYPTVLPLGVRIVKARYPKFTEPLRGNPTLKVTYTAMPERCPRCNGTYIENDYRFDPQGDVITITNEDLLYQACLKAILTVQGSNPYHRSFGSKITTRIGHKLVGASAQLVKEDVINALGQVRTLQAGQKKAQNISNREFLLAVQSVEVRPSADDPTIFFVDVTVRNASNRVINLTTVFSVPGTIALAGSNNLPLGMETAGLSREQSQRFLLGG